MFAGDGKNDRGVLGTDIVQAGTRDSSTVRLDPEDPDPAQRDRCSARTAWMAASVVEGLENAPRALLDLFRGENFGKLVVKVSDDPTRERNK